MPKCHIFDLAFYYALCFVFCAQSVKPKSPLSSTPHLEPTTPRT